MATVNANVFANHSTITAGNLRNGAATAIARTARASSIPPKYFFHGVQHAANLNGSAANRIPRCPIAVIIEAQIRSAYGVLVEGTLAERLAALPDAEEEPNEAAIRAEIAADPNIRLEAIALGASHASSVASYHITEADLIPSESREPILALVAPGPLADDEEYRDALGSTTGGWGIAVSSGHAPGELEDIEILALGFGALSVVESELAFCMFSLGQVAPVRAGCELFNSGHHYLSDASSSARHLACEKEVYAVASTEVTQVWNANKMLLRNALWHKSIHVITTQLLMNLATNLDTVERLDATGYGSFSVGLPAQEDILKRANAYIAVYNATRSTVEAHKHEVSLAQLQAVMAAMTALPVNQVLPAVAPAMGTIPAGEWRPGVTTRAEALRAYLAPACDAAEPVAAWLFGFYKEMCDDADLRKNSKEGSLLRSYALTRAAANHIGEMNNAITCYEGRKKFMKAEAAKGALEKRTLSA